MFLFSFEIYFKDSRFLLIVFLDKKKRSDLEQHLSTILGRPYSDIAHTPGPASLQQTPIFGEMGSRMLSGLNQTSSPLRLEDGKLEKLAMSASFSP